MKKLVFLSFAVLMTLTGFSQKNAYKLKMKVKGMKDTPCYLINWFGNQRYYRDTANFNSEGVVVFEGKNIILAGYMVFMLRINYFMKLS